MPKYLAGTTPDVENIAQTTRIKLSFTKESFAKLEMPRNTTEFGEHCTSPAAVDFTNFFAIFVVADTVDQISFDKSMNNSTLAAPCFNVAT
jgi:hypothetical protein